MHNILEHLDTLNLSSNEYLKSFIVTKMENNEGSSLIFSLDQILTLLFLLLIDILIRPDINTVIPTPY
jgi:hypothetical protein